MNAQTHAKAEAGRPPHSSGTFSASGILQRKCACGGPSGLAGECTECNEKDKKIRRKPAGAQSSIATAPPIVNEVLSSPGQALDESTRGFFETRFGHDFSQVRVHTDAKAAESAREVKALAYTLGRDIVFDTSRYAPASSAGRKLLAHELTHVVQQSTGVPRQTVTSGSPIEIGVEGDEFEREADERASGVSNDAGTPALRRATIARLQRIPAFEGLDEGGPKAEITGGEKEDRFRQCVKTSGPDPLECDPTTPLTWANFTGSAPAGAALDAFTVAPVDPVAVPIQDCLKLVYGRMTGPTLRFQAKLNSSKSWVKPLFRNANDPAKNGCAQQIANCEVFFDKEAAAGRTGGSWAMNTAADPACPAGITARGDRATKRGECATKVSADCNDTAQAESARLLSHEQGHLDISCVFAKKANAALTAGGDLATIKKAVTDKLQPTQDTYDADTTHGCKAGAQATWKKNIAENLKTITIP